MLVCRSTFDKIFGVTLWTEFQSWFQWALGPLQPQGAEQIPVPGGPARARRKIDFMGLLSICFYLAVLQQTLACVSLGRT